MLLEIKFNQLHQYSRQENIEIHNIPESVSQVNLEKYVIDILASIKINIVSYDIVAVHHIGKKKDNKPRIVVAHFVNRKNAFKPLKQCNKLRDSSNDQY